MRMAKCDVCGKPASSLKLTDLGWVCRDCYSGVWLEPWSARDKIRSRVLMPDGKVATGMRGLRIRDQRLKAQEARHR